MAATRISGLGTLTGATLATNDLLVVVDVSDVSMAGTGTDKSITATELKTFNKSYVSRIYARGAFR